MNSLFQHYKGKFYRLLNDVKHSETLDDHVLYETLYENPLGKLWVRPKKMFFENVIVDNKSIPRFKKIEVIYKSYPALDSQSMKCIESLMTDIFGHFDDQDFHSKFMNQNQIHLLIAFIGDHPIGFKLGYSLDKTTFYSWLGGVIPYYRGLGIATSMMEQQHSWCKANGFEKVQTKTKNKFKDMLILNIQNGFEVIGTYTDKLGEPKIILEKTLL